MDNYSETGQIDNYNADDFVINMFGPIDNHMSERVISQIRFFDFQFRKNNVPSDKRLITVIINSTGGDVADGLAIYDALNFVNAKISTVAIGTAESMAALLLSSGTRGLRKATYNCEVMIHQPLGGVSGQASDMVIATNHIESVRKKLNAILADNTGRTFNIIKKETERDKIMTAQQALEFGLIDEIIPSPNKAKKGV